jgi:hypothetical protein
LYVPILNEKKYLECCHCLFCGQVKNKIDMVDNLLEIELAYNLLSEGDKSDKVSLV